MNVINISKGQAKTLSTIMALQRQGMVCPSYAELAELTGYNVRNVRKQVKELVEKGILIKYPMKLDNGRNAPNAYALNKALRLAWEQE
jgi:DNA-binding Lrp family transcriptional regulator